MRRIDRVMDGMMKGTPWAMARASYAYSRMAGLTVWQAFIGAAELYLDYRSRKL